MTIELTTPPKWKRIGPALVPEYAGRRQPHPCVILGIDPAASSGWAIFAYGKYITSGVAKTQSEREYAVRLALNETLARIDMPKHDPVLVVVAEKWTRGGKWYAATMTGIGASWGKWVAELERVGLPKRRIVRVYPATWRGAVLGIGGRNATTEICHRLAILRANTLHLKRHGATRMCSDEAEAIAIAEWGTLAREVADVLPKRRAK